MLSPLRNRFGIPGVISVIALVFAMLGGAYAATNSGDGKATASAKKAKKGPRGPRGPAGPAGPAGPQGPAGANGKDGSNGANGANGEDGAPGSDGTGGTNGQDGKSIVDLGSFEGGVEEPPFPCKGAGGQQYEVEGSEGSEIQTVCNGVDGSPWTAGGTLPPGATMTGNWAFSADDGETEIWIPISFPLPLIGEGLSGEEKVHYQTDGNFETSCPGSVAEPAALPGHLCVYATLFGGTKVVNATFAQVSKMSTTNTRGASPFGALLRFTFSGAAGSLAKGSGSFAVTGAEPEEP